MHDHKVTELQSTNHLGTSPCETIEITDPKWSMRRTKNSLFGMGVTHTQLPSTQAQVPPAVWKKAHLLQTNLPRKVRQEGCHELCWLLPSHFWNHTDVQDWAAPFTINQVPRHIHCMSFYELLPFNRNSSGNKNTSFCIPQYEETQLKCFPCVDKRSEYSRAQILLSLPVRLLSQ